MPSITNGFQVLAFSHDPASVSRTGAYVASVWRVVLRPPRSTSPVDRGQEITVHAEIVNRLDQPVRVANVPVYLGQVIYDQRGLEYSPGGDQLRAAAGPRWRRSPTRRASHVHDQSPLAHTDPVYFEANLVKPEQFYPYGYSPILAIRFRK